MKQSKKLNKGSAGQNRKVGDVFSERYSNKTDVINTPSGLLYRIIETGTGSQPVATNRVLVNQRILNVDGSVIADTYKTGLPDEFALSEAIDGYREALLMMREGDRWELVIPPELAWGKKGAGNKIGPNATLIFDVRLLNVI